MSSQAPESQVGLARLDPTQRFRELAKKANQGYDSLVKNPDALKAIIADYRGMGMRAQDTVGGEVAASGALKVLGGIAAEAGRHLLKASGLPEPDAFWGALSSLYSVAPGGAGSGGNSAVAVPGGLDWARMGADAARLWLDVPTLRFMLGPMSIPRKQKKAVDPAQRAHMAEQKKSAREALREGVVYASASEASAAEMKQVEALGAERGAKIGAWLHPFQATHGVAVRCLDGRVRRRLLPLVAWLFDPLSYSQTIENLFYFSYLVKAGDACLYLGPSGGTGASGGGDDFDDDDDTNDASGGGSSRAATVNVPYIRLFSGAEATRRSERQLKDEAVSDDEEEGDGDDSAPVLEPRAGSASASAGSAGSGGTDVGSNRARRASAGAGAKGRAAAIESRSLQLIVQLDVDSWRAICRAYGLVSPRLPHRRSKDSLAPPGFKFSELPQLPGAKDGDAGDAASQPPPAKAKAKGRRGKAAAAAEEEEEGGEEDEEEEDAGEGRSSKKARR